MLPAFTVSCTYLRDSISTESEIDDLCDALSAVKAWTEETGIRFAPRFADPEAQAEIVGTMMENGLLARLRRWIRQENRTPEEALLRRLELSSRATVSAASFESAEAFAHSALEALDKVERQNYFAMGKPASNSLTVAVWDRSREHFWCWFNLYRFEDRMLVLQVRLLSTEAWENRELQARGNELLAKLESKGKFRRWQE